MAAIRPSSATIACLYITFLAFVLLCIYSFTPFNGRLIAENVSYGVGFLLLSTFILGSGITAGDVEDSLLRGLLLCLGSMWAAVGVFNVTRDISRPPTIWSNAANEALFPGYGAFFFIFLIFVFGSILHQATFTAVLSFGLFLSTIFEIASLWRPVHMSAGAYYVLLSALVVYMMCQKLVNKFKGGDFKTTQKRKSSDPDVSNDYTIVGYSMEVIVFAVFASHVTGATTVANNAFMWVGSAGFFQAVCGIVALRRNDPYCGCYFTLYGTFWCAVAYNLALNHFSGTNDLPLLPVFIFFLFTFLLASLISIAREMFHALQNILLCIFCIAFCVDGVQGHFLGGMGWVCFLFSLYGLAAHMSRMKQTPYKLPLGRRPFDRAQVQQSLKKHLSCCAKRLYKQDTKQNGDGLFSTEFSDMGYSKYIELDTIGFAVNAVSALSILWIPANFNLLSMPWTTVLGGVAQFTVGCIGFARGLTFESCSFIIFSTMWIILGTARSLGTLGQDNSVAMCVGSISYMVILLLLIGLSLVVSKTWFLITFLFELIALAFLLNILAVPSYEAYEIIVVLLFTAVCIYGFLASALKVVWGRDVLPMGNPIIEVSFLHSQGHKAFWADAQKQSGVKAIADIMNRGGIVGIPTDTVYVLAAAVKFPESVERAYLTKKLAEDRPMSMWISNVNQLAAGREQFGEMLWAFMNAVWPSTISCVVNKGPWLDSLGVGYAGKYIGRPDSIAVRMPDNMVTSFLIDHTGPVSTSSANPTGEADTTHHLQVIAKLGLKNCDGILCDGPSFANSASTVVDCRKIDEGKIGFFRIGLEPKSRVEEIFERIQAQFRNKTASHRDSMQSTSETLDSGVYIRRSNPGSVSLELEGHINDAFDDSDDGDHSSKDRNVENIGNDAQNNFGKSTNILEKWSEPKPESENTKTNNNPQIKGLVDNLDRILSDAENQNQKLEDVNLQGSQMAINIPETEPYGSNVDEGEASTEPISDDDEPLTSLKSRKRRQLQSQINTHILNRGQHLGLTERTLNQTKNKETDSSAEFKNPLDTFRTTLEVNVNQYKKFTVDNTPNQRQAGDEQRAVTSQLPFEEESTTSNKKKIVPLFNFSSKSNNLSDLERGSENTNRKDDLINATGKTDNTYSLAFVNSSDKEVSDRLNTSAHPERPVFFKQRTEL
ncbi:uncharacterized protein LOC118766235 [Octopus sinensis]|uniref:Threonylcarbamoyl-AMP synthase n=1 Tax=Octopus sinensis TaxID=2607531 RepID=A0A7E6FCF9_9MOLL|nr:uncharacterized protein LOC118766235 [Octopus sinensis]